jgi:hypothetical protein
MMRVSLSAATTASKRAPAGGLKRPVSGSPLPRADGNVCAGVA